MRFVLKRKTLAPLQDTRVQIWSIFRVKAKLSQMTAVQDQVWVGAKPFIHSLFRQSGHTRIIALFFVHGAHHLKVQVRWPVTILRIWTYLGNFIAFADWFAN